MGNSFANKYRKSYKNWPGLLILALFVFITILPSTSVAATVDVTLAWDASSGADGYRLFYREEGQSYNYSSPDWQGASTTCTIYGLDDTTTYHFVVRAYNSDGESGDSNEETWVPGGANNPPVLDPIGSKSVNEGDPLSFSISASDSDGDGLTYDASNLPPGANFDPATQSFSWTPDYGDAGNYDVLFTVTDNGTPPMSDSETVTITVIIGSVNQPPVLNPIGPKSVNEGELLTFTVTATDPDGTALPDLVIDNLSVSSGEAYEVVENGLTSGALVYIDRNYTFNVVPAFLDGATYIKTANDDKRSSDTSFITFDVNRDVTVYVAHDDRITDKPSWLATFADTGDNINTSDTLSLFAKDFSTSTITLGGNEGGGNSMYSLIIVTQSGDGGNRLSYSVGSLPSGASFDPATQTFDWTPSSGDGGNYYVTFTVTDDGTPAESDSEVVTISVGNVNRPPVLGTIGSKSVDEGDLLTFTVTASDPDGDGLIFSASNVPSGASFNPSTRVFDWTPALGDAGNYNVTFTVTDDGSPAESDSETVTITVGNVNRPPVLNSIGSKSVDEGTLLTFTLTASDPDGDGLTFSASNVPTGATFNPSTRVFNWTPAFGEAGNYSVTFTVTDDGTPAESDSEVVTISVGNVNRPPVLGTIGSKSVDEGDILTFTISASDPDGDTLTYSASNLPSGANFNSGTRIFNWTPAIGDSGNYNVQFTVTDNGTPPESDFEIVAITVIDPASSNLPPDQPVITTPYYGELECDLLMTVQTEPFSDPDGDAHIESRWQIVKQADSSVVLEITSTEHLTELPVPHTVLDRDSTYLVSVQFYDAYYEPSGWSDSIEFTTTSNIEDFDGDGIPDAHEVDDTVDLNEDGIPDNNQPDIIKSILSAVGSNEPFGVSKISASIDAIEVLEPINPAAIFDKTNKPETFLFGLASFRLRLNQVGATVLARIYYSRDISSASRYFLYDTVNGWHDHTQYTTFNQDGRSVTVELKDGGHGDSDGVANGVIVDPGGVVGAATTVTTGGADSGAGGGGCFIATAAFGSYVEPHVKLRAASYSEEHYWLKPIVRILLMPLEGVSYILTRTSLVTMILLGFMLIVSVLSFYAVIYKRRKYQA